MLEQSNGRSKRVSAGQEGRTQDDLCEGLYEILFGIKGEWELTQKELSQILHRSLSTLNEWRAKKKVHVSHTSDANDLLIYEFVEFFDSVTSLFPRKSDQIKWIRARSEAFGGESPLTLMARSPANLYHMREWVDHLSRP